MLVGIGLVLVFDADLLVSQVDFGVAPTAGDFLLGIAVGMVAYTGIETISNMAEEARDAKRTIPRGVGATVIAVVGLYAFLPAIALSAMPVTQDAERASTPPSSARPSPTTRFSGSSRTSASDRRDRRARGLRRDARRGDPADRDQRRG